MSEQKTINNNEKGGRRKLVFVLCIIVILILLGDIIYLVASKKEDKPLNRNVVVNEDNIEEILAEQEKEERTPIGSYEVTMNSTWNFESGNSPSDNAYVENAKANINSVYFDVIRTDTEKTIYQSPIIPVGSHLENISLDEDLPDGTYDCLIVYNLLDEEEKETISTVKLSLTINIGQ